MALILVFCNSRLALKNHGYGAVASPSVLSYSPAFACAQLHTAECGGIARLGPSRRLTPLCQTAVLIIIEKCRLICAQQMCSSSTCDISTERV